MVSIHQYKSNPCRIAPIPYWKIKAYKVPDNLFIIHDDDFNYAQKKLYDDTLYFRLKHDLKNVEMLELEDIFKYTSVNTNCTQDLKEVVDIINKSYTDIKVDIDRVMQWVKSDVFDESLWVFIVDIYTQKPIGLGIAELDRYVREGALEWIQVLPQYRNRGLGQALVNKLLYNLIDKVDFVTVSGEVNNNTNPEKLYRRCGFVGDDVWHILVQKQ